jgi:hypothetical protein
VPIDDLGLDGPMMVIGRETALPSGRVGLLGVTPAGDIVVVEFKTGSENSDYRHALAQLLDFGVDLWRMDPEAFETTVTVSYLATRHCPATDLARDAPSLREAARRTWPHLDDEALDGFERRVAARLDDGGFHFVLAAQRITRNSRSPIEYLQQTHATGSWIGRQGHSQNRTVRCQVTAAPRSAPTLRFQRFRRNGPRPQEVTVGFCGGGGEAQSRMPVPRCDMPLTVQPDSVEAFGSVFGKRPSKRWLGCQGGTSELAAGQYAADSSRAPDRFARTGS